MNAPARIARYEPTVDTFLPLCSDEEKRLRCGVLYIRDKASSSIRYARPEPGMILQTIESIAATNAFAPMPIDHLSELRAGLVRMMMVAMAFEARGPGRPIDEN